MEMVTNKGTALSCTMFVHLYVLALDVHIKTSTLCWKPQLTVIQTLKTGKCKTTFDWIAKRQKPHLLQQNKNCPPFPSTPVNLIFTVPLPWHCQKPKRSPWQHTVRAKLHWSNHQTLSLPALPNQLCLEVSFHQCWSEAGYLPILSHPDYYSCFFCL